MGHLYQTGRIQRSMRSQYVLGKASGLSRIHREVDQVGNHYMLILLRLNFQSACESINVTRIIHRAFNSFDENKNLIIYIFFN